VNPREPRLDALYAELLRAGESAPEIRGFLAHHQPDDLQVLGLLRLAVPVRFLEFIATTAPWSERPRNLAGVVLNPRTPPSLALRLIPGLLWRDLAEAAHSPRLVAAVRNRAEAALLEMVPDLRTGEKVTLAKIATPPVLRLVISDPDRKVSEAALINPRLREDDLLLAIRQPTAPVSLLEEAATSHRWSANYAVRRELVLQPRTPLAVALSQLSSLIPRDLFRIAATEGLAPLIQRAALRVAKERAP
jgi:hypothetical protein